MNCPTNGISIPTPLTEICSGIYYSTNCVVIPEAIPILLLPEGATQTRFNDALTAALVEKQRQIVALQALIDALDARIVNLETP